MKQQHIQWINLVRAALAAIVFAYVAGDASTSIANWLVTQGGPGFMREPINAGLALLFIWLWTRWQPATQHSAPKWGHVFWGLLIGLSIGIALPAAALFAMVGLKAASIKAPEVEGIALLVPFIFLILHGFSEESLLRTIAQRFGHYGFGALGGIGLAAVCFGVLQALQGYLGVWNIINGLLFGACLGFLALGPGGLWSAIGAHAGWSWLETAALGQPGQIAKSGQWLAGSGPDSYGSPLFTLVLIVTLAVQLALHLRAQKRTI